jgi:hypothetical protein
VDAIFAIGEMHGYVHSACLSVLLYEIGGLCSLCLGASKCRWARDTTEALIRELKMAGLE